MITAVISAGEDIEALGATLAALVPAVAEGVLRDAVIVDRSSDGHVRRIAEAAGTDYVKASGGEAWRAGAQKAKGPWVLLLDAGDHPEPTWTVEVERFLRIVGPTRAARAALMPREGFWLASGLRRILPFLASRTPLQPGLLCLRTVVLDGMIVRGRVEHLAARLRRL